MLDYLWQSSTGSLSEQSAHYRFYYALKMAREMQWSYESLSAEQWEVHCRLHLNTKVNGIYIPNDSFNSAFDAMGSQVGPVLLRLTGSIQGLKSLFSRCGWQIASKPSDISDLYVVTVLSITVNV